MTIQSAYPYMYRPGVDGLGEFWRSSAQGSHYLGAYEIIKRDLRRLFEYIEPSIANQSAYSHRTFELLFRACTEIESNFKSIASMNGKDWSKSNIIRYSDMEEALNLSEFKVVCVVGEFPVFQPFEAFANLERDSRSPPWYRAYNDAKHSRMDGFGSASIVNAIHAVGGLYALLCAQYEPRFDSFLQLVGGLRFSKSDLFRVEASPQWAAGDSYSFSLEDFKNGALSPLQHQLQERP